jgi:4-hydroxy-tetrahydrodipicolinate synthase
MSSDNRRPGGAYTALVTPFNEDGSDVDVAALVAHAQWVHERSRAGLVLFGTTGEGPWLSLDEQSRCLTALAEVGLLSSTIVAITTQALPDTTALARMLRGSAAQGVLALPPYYFGADRTSALPRYFETVAQVCELPVLGYHIPKHAPPIALADISDGPLVGVKDSGGDPSYSGHVRATGGCVLWGSESVVPNPVDGFVSASGNVVPELVVPTTTDLVAGRTDTQAQRRMAAVRRLSGGSSRPWLLKRLAQQRHGVELGPCRPPSAPGTAPPLADVLAAAGIEEPARIEGAVSDG